LGEAVLRMELDLESLKESKDFLNDLYRNVTTAIFLADGEARIRHFNDAFTALFLPAERAALGELCGNAIGCCFVEDEGLDCGKTSNCGVCALRRDIIRSFTERVPVYRDSLSRDFVIGGKRVRKHFRFTTKYEIYRGIEYVLVLVDDVSELVDARDALEERNAFLARRNEGLEALLRRETATLMDAARELDRLGLERDELEREVRHRVGNNLQVISSLLNLGRSLGAEEGLGALRNRILSVIEVYRQATYETEGSVVDLPGLVRSLAASGSVRSSAESTPIESEVSLPSLRFDEALPVGIVIGDFLYACRAPNKPGGEPPGISISIAQEGGRGRCQLAAKWEGAFARRSLDAGEMAVSQLIARQSGGELFLELSEAAVRVLYDFPLMSC
jgi:two-component sensor histidine kinase